MTGAYALGALTGEERRAVESHLAECAECAQEVREFEATAARLGAAEETAPPPRMRAAVLSRIAEVRQLPPDVGGDGGLPERPDGPGGPDRPGPIPLQGRRRSAGRAPSTWIAAAAAAALIAIAAVLGAVAINLNNELREQRAQSAEVRQVLAAPDARALSGGVGSGGRGSVVYSEEAGRAVFVATGLPAPPSGQTYQAWYVDGDNPRSAGVFQPDSSGDVTQVLEGDLGAAQAVAFTVEPAGGSTQPTSDPVLALELPA
jgi:anti-sigma-K factor RskA